MDPRTIGTVVDDVELEDMDSIHPSSAIAQTVFQYSKSHDIPLVRGFHKPTLRFLANKLLSRSAFGFYLEIIGILFSIAFFGFYVYQTYDMDPPRWIFFVELSLVMYFVVEYVFRLFAAEDRWAFFFSFHSFVELITIIPFLIAVAFGQSFSVGFLRVLRLLRMLRILRAYRILLVPVTGSTRQTFRLLLTIMLLILCTAGIVHLVENADHNEGPSFFDSVYFVIITLATVGYGDIVPTTSWAKLVIVLMVIVGMVLIPAQTLRLVHLLEMEGSVYGASVRRGKCILISGNVQFGSMFEFLREFYHEDHGIQNTKCIIVNDHEPNSAMRSLLLHPFYESKIRYIRGSLVAPSDVLISHTQEADAIFLLADHHAADPQREDAQTILRILASRNSDPSSTVLAQVMNPENKRRVTFSGADQIISLQEMKLKLLAMNFLYPGTSTLICNLTRCLDITSSMAKRKLKGKKWNAPWLDEYEGGTTKEIYAIPAPDCLIGIPFTEASYVLYTLFNVIMIGCVVEDEDEYSYVVLNPGKNSIREGQEIFVIAEDQQTAVDLSVSGGGIPFTEASYVLYTLFNVIMIGCVVEDEDEYSYVVLNPGKNSIREGQEIFVIAEDQQTAVDLSVSGPDMMRTINPDLHSAIMQQSQLSFMKSELPNIHSRGASLDRGALGSRERPVISLDIPRESSLTDIYRVRQKTLHGDVSTRSRPIWRSSRDRPRVSFLVDGEKKGTESLTSDLNILVPGEDDDRVKSPIESSPDDQKFLIGIEGLPGRRGSMPMGPEWDQKWKEHQRARERSAFEFDAFVASVMPPFVHRSLNGDKVEMRKVVLTNFYVKTTSVSLESVTVEDVGSLDLENHLIVAGTCDGLCNLIIPLRSRTLKFIPPIVILSAVAPTVDEWKNLSHFRGIFYVNGSAMQQSDLLRAGIESCRGCIVLAKTHTEGISEQRQTDEYMIDSETVFVELAIEDFMNSSLGDTEHDKIIISEVIHSSSMQFIRTRMKNLDRSYYSMTRRYKRRKRKSPMTRIFEEFSMANVESSPLYASGRVFPSSMLDTLLCQTYYNPYIVEIVEKLVHRGLDVDEKTSGCLKVVDVPEFLIDCTFLECYEYFTFVQNSVLLGIYRGKNQLGNEMEYVYAAPDKNKIVHATDKLFVLTSADKNCPKDKKAF
eukprot:TRINITY_DN12308_c0_g1_i1.p1 TRINITY_DN12308_c0_g1~~TRINITY_DN12308_c0_g1_i1.p1  ORF type:complete len:1161 (+),score=274.19 TRINITY_DN12308_c0_g1_i1:119-3601(+)